jgi:heterodisulfide reductase subunit D
MSLSRLKALEDEMKKCFRCSLCKMIPLPVVQDPRFADGCPASRLFHAHGYSGSGKSIMALSLLDGRIGVDPDLAEVTFACTACGLCDVSCKFIMDAERHLINMALREHLVEEGFGLPEHDEALRRIGENQDTGEESGARFPAGEARDILLLGGRTAAAGARAGTREKLLRLLRAAGVNAVTLGESEPDTGLMAYWTGRRDRFQRAAGNLIRCVERANARTVIAVSGSDLGMLRSKYPEAGLDPGFRVLHATELLDTLIGQGRLRFTRPVARRVTFHDPCYLGRQSEPPVKWDGQTIVTRGCMACTDPPRLVNRGVNGVFEPPRNCLRAIPGVEFREMHRIREYAFCCGGGGGVPEAFPRLARETALHRIEEARATGADCIVTACGTCRETLSRAQAAGPVEQAMPVLDVIDLVAEAAGIPV